jgi:PKHD-type hydroxylase
MILVNKLEESDVDYLTKIVAKCTRIQDGMTTEDNVLNKDIRDCKVSFIDYEEFPYLATLTTNIVQNVNKELKFDVDGVSNVQYIKYFTGGKYEWHFDSPKITIIIQLTESSKYKGGDLSISSAYSSEETPTFRGKGTIIAFPSYIPHKVSEVTQGEREVMVFWGEGAPFK